MRDKKGNDSVIIFGSNKWKQNLQNEDMLRRKNIFQSVIICKECGGGFRRRLQKDKDVQACWMCSNYRKNDAASCSNSIEINEEELIQIFEDYFSEILKKSNQFTTCMEDESREQNEKVQAGMAGYDLKNQKRKILQKFENGKLVCNMSNEQMKQLIEKIEVDKDGNVDIIFRNFGVS